MLRNIGFISHKHKHLLSNEVAKKISENNSISLEEILSEESLIAELQSNSLILLDYFTKEKMADYFIAPLKKLKEFTQYKLKPKTKSVYDQIKSIY